MPLNKHNIISLCHNFKIDSHTVKHVYCVVDVFSKKEKLRAAIQERVNKEEHAYRLVEKMVLLDSVDKEFFLNAVSLAFH